MALIAAGATFTFTSDKGNLTANVTGVSVDTPEAQMVDMTPPTASANTRIMVPTGELTGGTMSVDYIRYSGQTDPVTLLGGVGSASFSSPAYSVSKQVVLQSASEEARLGDVIRGTLSFAWTDYSP